jgi:site-specific DNA recombinase
MRNTAKIYCRLSKDKKDQTSLADQERRCRAHLYLLGVDDADITVFAEDPGTSGYKEDVDLPERDRFIKYPADIAIVWMHDRLSRRGVEDSFKCKRLLQESGSRYIALQDGIDTLIEGNDINLAFRAIAANQYSQTISKNSKRGKDTAAGAGKWPGGPKWDGYKSDADGKWRGPYAGIDEPRAKLLREIRDRYIALERMPSVAADFNARGLRTINNRHWRAENMLDLILNPRYIGLNNIGVPGDWTPIFTPAERDEVVAVRESAERMKTWPTRPTGYRTYPLTGFVHCAACNQTMNGSARRYKGKPHRRYACCNEGCMVLSRSADPLELLVTEAIFYRLDTPELGKLLQPAGDSSQSDVIMAEHARQKAKLDRLIDAYQDGLLTKQQFITRKTAIESAIQAAETALRHEMGKRTGIKLQAGQTVREWWLNATLEKRRQLVSLLVEKITVNPTNPGRIAAKDYYHGYRFNVADVAIQWVDDLENRTPMRVEDPALLAQEAAVLR